MKKPTTSLPVAMGRCLADTILHFHAELIPGAGHYLAFDPPIALFLDAMAE